MIRLLYAIESWALAALGILHIAATPRYFAELSTQALWFFSGGVLMVLAAALNLLNRTYGTGAPGMRWVCVTTNVVVVAIAVTGGILGHASAAQWVIVLGILGPLTVLSFWSPARDATSGRGAA